MHICYLCEQTTLSVLARDCTKPFRKGGDGNNTACAKEAANGRLEDEAWRAVYDAWRGQISGGLEQLLAVDISGAGSPTHGNEVSLPDPKNLFALWFWPSCQLFRPCLVFARVRHVPVKQSMCCGQVQVSANSSAALEARGRRSDGKAS